MAKAPPSISLLLLLSAAVFLALPAVISAIGVNYGTLGNLPPPTEVANFLKTQTSIDSVKIFNVDPNILRAFAGTGISVVVTVPNGDIPALANGRRARRWVSANILPFHPQTKIKYISVGNEILLTGDNNMISNLLPAMRNLNKALVRAGVRDVKVTTAHALNIIAYDLNGAPSTGRFRPGWDKGVLAPILAYHRRTRSPFMINPYPYFGFDPKNINFAIFRSPYKAVRDPFTHKIYTNMYDALLDSTYSAMKALGYGDVNIVVGETGWPSACDAPWCSLENAAWFNRNIIKRSQRQGTPLMPNRRFETYLFGLFNEEGKPGPTAERNWGLFHSDFSPVYDVGLLRNGQGGGGRPAPALPAPSTGGGKWCVAKLGASDAQLQGNIDWVCSQGGVDCRPIQAGGSCFNPNSMRTHASFVMNAYFQKNGRTDGACNFRELVLFGSRRGSMATLVQCLSSCATLNPKFKSLSLNGASSSLSTRRGVCSSSLSFSQSVSQCVAFSSGNMWVEKNKPARQSIVCEAAPTKKADSAAKRARQAEKRRVYNKSKKSEARTRMKKVLEALDGLKKKADAVPDEIVTVEKLIGEAYSAIDKAVKVRALHKNTGARRKSRLARRKKAVEIHHGWYVPAAAAEAVTMAA